jgi:hypothetical protein
MAAGKETAEATETAIRAAMATAGITGTLGITGTPGIKVIPAAMVPRETAEPQVVLGTMETARGTATRVERATETAATQMRDKAILAAGEAHQVREALRAPDNRQAKEPRPAGAIQQVKESPRTRAKPQTRARRRARKQAMVPVLVSQHPL